MNFSDKDIAFQLLQWGNRIKAIALTGLGFCSEIHDKHRYDELVQIASEMLASINEGLDYNSSFAKEINRILKEDLRSGVAGYVTPKVCIAAAVFDEEGKLLLVKPNGGDGWCLPGGWAEEYCTPAKNAEREVLEETQLEVRTRSLLGVFDSRFHPFETTVASYTLLFECEFLGGKLTPFLSEVSQAQFCSQETLPLLIPGVTQQIEIAFAHWHKDLIEPFFDSEHQ